MKIAYISDTHLRYGQYNLDEIDPDYVIPVHTENPMWFKDKWSIKTVVLRNIEQE